MARIFLLGRREMRYSLLLTATLLVISACAHSIDEQRQYYRNKGLRSPSPSQKIDTSVAIDAKSSTGVAAANLVFEEFAELFTRPLPLHGTGSDAAFILRVTAGQSHQLRGGGAGFRGEATLLDSATGAVLGSFYREGRQHNLLFGAEESWRNAYLEMMTNLKDDVTRAFSQPSVQMKLAAQRLRSTVRTTSRSSTHNPLDDPTFREALALYKSQAVKPELPETARRYKVQADAAVRERKYVEAIELYQDALRIAPWWPEGHFNSALLLAEQGLYPEAVIEMQRYLALVPGATDARAAQDKIYEWERRTK